MSNLSVTLILLCGVYGAFAGRRYIAIPVDGFDVIELSPIALPRIPRQAEGTLEPLALSSVRQEDPESRRLERSNPVLDYVDFGGQTGSNGAFSWYADYPAHH